MCDCIEFEDNEMWDELVISVFLFIYIFNICILFLGMDDFYFEYEIVILLKDSLSYDKICYYYKLLEKVIELVKD